MNRILSIPAAALFLATAGAGAASACADITVHNSGAHSLASVVSFGCTIGSFDSVGVGNTTYATLEDDASIVAGNYGHWNRHELHATSGGVIVAQNEANNALLSVAAHRGAAVEILNRLDNARIGVQADDGALVRVATYRP